MVADETGDGPQNSASEISEDKSDFKALIPVAAATCISIIALGTVIPILPFMVTEAGGSKFQASAIFSVFSFFSFVAAPFWGRLSDRFGRKLIMIASVAAMVLAYFWLYTAESLWAIYASRGFAGFTSGWLVASQAFAADVTRREDRAKAMGILGAAFGVGFIIGPALSAFTVGMGASFLSTNEYGLPLLIATGCAVLSLVVALVFVREPKRRAGVSDASKETHKGLLEVARTPVLGALFVPYFLVFFVFTAVEGAFAIWANHVLGYGPKEVGMFLAFAGVCGAITQGGLIGRFIKRFGEAQTAVIGVSALSLGCLCLGLSQTPAWTALAIALLAIGLGLHNPSMQGLMSILAPSDWRGGVLGAAHSCASLARIVGPALGGLSLQFLGFTTQFFVGAAVLIPAIYLIFRFRKASTLREG